MKLHEAPTPLQKIIADVSREFKKKGRAKARVRAVLDNEITSRDVSEIMTPTDKYMVEALAVSRAREGAKAVAVVAETWSVPHDHMRDHPVSAMLALYLAENQSLAAHPHRIERLMVVYETAEFGVLCQADLLRNPNRVGRWELNRVAYDRPPGEDELHCSGRFTHIYEKAKQ